MAAEAEKPELSLPEIITPMAEQEVPVGNDSAKRIFNSQIVPPRPQVNELKALNSFITEAAEQSKPNVYT